MNVVNLLSGTSLYHDVDCLWKADQGNACCLHTQSCHTYLSDNEKCEGSQCDQTNAQRLASPSEVCFQGCSEGWGQGLESKSDSTAVTLRGSVHIQNLPLTWAVCSLSVQDMPRHCTFAQAMSVHSVPAHSIPV